MKTLSSFLKLLLAIAFISAAIVGVFDTNTAATVACVATPLIGYTALQSLGFITHPTFAFHEYIGAPGVSTSSGSAGVQVINNERQRGAYMAYKTKPEYSDKDIIQGYLRIEANISNSNNIVQFKTFEGDGTTVAPTERRLDRNDKFVITDLGIFLLKQDTANGKYTGILCSYPNITIFGAAAAADLWALYNGELEITINKKKYLVGMDTRRFLYVPNTQQSASTNNDEACYKHGFIKLTPHIELDGSGSNEIVLKFPSHAGWAGATPSAAGFTHKVVLYCRGMLITGGSSNS